MTALFLLCLFVVPWINVAAAQEITIAAASDLTFVFKELAEEYEKTGSNRIKLTLGSSGNLYAQLRNGAPFDLYFSADISYPKKLEEAGLTVPGSLYRYALGRIVLWARRDSRLELDQGFAALRDPSIKAIAIANPKHAPYGRAAVSAMEHFRIYEDVKTRLVLGENISQAAQFVESGACEIGVIALSLALAPAMQSKGTYWEVPAESHLPIEQGAVILKSSARQEAAHHFLTFVRSQTGRKIMNKYGFVLPEMR